MKKILTFLACFGVCFTQAQGLLIRPGTSFKCSGNVTIVSEGGNITNNGNGDFSGANIVITGAGTNKIAGSGAFVMKDLSITKVSGTLLLQSPVSVNGQLNIIKGMIDLNAQRINLSSASTITGESEFNRIFGSGDVSITINLNAPSSANPGNLGLVITSFSNFGSTVIRRGHDALSPNAIKRYFEVIPANNASLNASIRFQYFDSELNNQNENFLTLVKKASGSSFTNLGNDGSSNTFNFVGKNNVNEMGIFTLVGPAGSLPVKFVLFNSSCEAGSTKLTWKTAGEINSKRFDVERSADGLNWKVIGDVVAAGNSNIERTYTYNDNGPSGSLYRIVEYDVNEQKTYTPVIRSSCASPEEFKVWPNPVVGFVNISLGSLQHAEAAINIIDAKGAVVQKTRKEILAGVNQVSVDMSKLPAGVYTVSAVWGNMLREVKVVKR